MCNRADLLVTEKSTTPDERASVPTPMDAGSVPSLSVALAELDTVLKNASVNSTRILKGVFEAVTFGVPEIAAA